MVDQNLFFITESLEVSFTFRTLYC